MKRKQLIEGALAMLAGLAFVLCLFGAEMLLTENTKGWLLCGAALLIAVPVVILLNREERTS